MLRWDDENWLEQITPMVVQRNLTTVAEFEQFADAHPDRRFELIDGEIVEKMPTQVHAYIVAMLTAALVNFMSKSNLGYVLVEARYGNPENDQNSRVPDLSFILNDKGKLVDKGAAPYMPDLAVEVQSPGQSDKLMTDKAQYYLANGSQMVWLIYPAHRMVEVLTNDTRRLLSADDTLSGGDLLPGFEAAINTLFPEDHD